MTRRSWAWTLTTTAALLVVVWVASMRFYPSFSGRLWSAAFYRGGIGFLSRSGYVLGDDDGFEWYDSRQWIAIWWFSYEDEKSSPVNDFSMWQIPLWPFVLLTGVPGVWMFVNLRMPPANACPTCGYDKSGLLQSPNGTAPCPECGKDSSH